MNFQIKKISDYHGDSFNRIVCNLYRKVMDLNNEYPGFRNWYFMNAVQEIRLSKRDILFVQVDNKIAGLSILKNTNEKKICTLRVEKGFQNNGIGSLLFKKSFEYLGTEKPLITVSDRRFHEFEKLFSFFNFNLENAYYEFYSNHSYEYSFNGLLVSNNKKEIAIA